MNWDIYTLAVYLLFTFVIFGLGFMVGYINQLSYVKKAERYVDQAERLIEEKNDQLAKYQRHFAKELNTRPE